MNTYLIGVTVTPLHVEEEDNLSGLETVDYLVLVRHTDGQAADELASRAAGELWSKDHDDHDWAIDETSEEHVEYDWEEPHVVLIRS